MRTAIVGLVFFVIALYAGSCANGFWGAMAAERTAMSIGYGLSGRDVRGLQDELGVDDGCNAGGVGAFLITWAGGTLAFGRRRRKGTETAGSGSAQSTAGPICPTCESASGEPGARFCRRCGTRLDAGGAGAAG